jgi:serine/threonine protein phosphatase PrpC
VSPLKLVAAGVTDVGRVRDGNEDDFLVDARTSLVAVADGMGGHRGGEVASATALEALRAAVASGEPIRDAIAVANDAVLEKSVSDQQLHGMGTTVTAGTLARGGTLLVGHVGDSRAYLVRDGQMSQITNDHSLVEEMVRGGELTPEQAEVHPQRSIITRALGIDPEIDVDVYPVELRDGDRVLLCSDGLTTMVRQDEIAGILSREHDPERAAQVLVDAANAAGGEDNVTALVVEVVEDDAAPAAAETSDEDTTDDDTTETAPVKPKRRRARAVLRVLLWVLPVLAILAIAFGAIAWYARGTYFVGVNKSEVTIFKGRPGGLLGWDPTVEKRTGIEPSQLTEKERDDVQADKTFSSRSSADDYVARLQKSIEERTTATTVPPEATVPPAAPPAPPQ